MEISDVRNREGLTASDRHIINNYDQLSPITIFHHADRYSWHVDDPLYDGVRVLSRLQLPFVHEKGYANLRCTWQPGCPPSIHPYTEEPETPPKWDVVKELDYYYMGFFDRVFPAEAQPDEIGTPCCAQFAVADWQIRKRPRMFYRRFRRWILEQNDAGVFSGRIVEFAWHSELVPRWSSFKC